MFTSDEPRYLSPFGPEPEPYEPPPAPAPSTVPTWDDDFPEVDHEEVADDDDTLSISPVAPGRRRSGGPL